MAKQTYIRGADKTARALKRLSPAMTEDINAALDKGANEIRSKAASIAPRDTGELAEAIEVRDSLDGFTGRGAIGNFARMVKGEAGGLIRHIGVFPERRGSPGWYAAWVEFGTATTRAQPFLMPAAGCRFPAHPDRGHAAFGLRRREPARHGSRVAGARVVAGYRAG